LIKVNKLHRLKLAKEAVEPNKSLFVDAKVDFWRILCLTEIYEEEMAIRNYAAIVKLMGPKCSLECVSKNISAYQSPQSSAALLSLFGGDFYFSWS
jgi:hypothetical protein